MIRETIVVTSDAAGKPHIAPLGLIADGEHWIIAPFRPSKTLDNLLRGRVATVNYVADTRLFAGLVTGRRDWPLEPAAPRFPPRLRAALSHAEMRVVDVAEHAERPRFRCAVERRQNHLPFEGFNRAQGAVLEAAILITRLAMLPREKVDREFAYLAIAVDKTAGPEEREAWGWLVAARDAFYAAA